MKKDSKRKTTKANSSAGLLDFDVLEVPLEGRNLVEASAGTGKTYSIALLTIRLLVETKIELKEMLMVTFTNAAVAELEERIKLFVKKANQYCITNTTDDDNIINLIKNNKKEKDLEIIKQKLKKALEQIDETSIFTIHGFCHNTLTEFAFETGQLYDSIPLESDDEIIEECVNEIWRTKFTKIFIPLLKEINEIIQRVELIDHIKNIQSGKKIFTPSELFKDILDSESEQKKQFKILEKHLKEKENLKEIFIQVWNKNEKLYKDIIKENKKLNEYFLKVINDPISIFKQFEIAIIENSRLISEKLEDLFTIYTNYIAICATVKQFKSKLKHSFYQEAYPLLLNEVKKKKNESNLISYDDMIENVHQAIKGKNSKKFIEGLREKYKAVFLDEFQDTDKLQFEIFDEAFKKPGLMFFIGDPKQSIYSFRRADIFTYFRASETVDAMYTMKTNFRSTENFIESMNKFFIPDKNFNTFLFPDNSSKITYQNVNSPKKNLKGKLLFDNKNIHPISFHIQKNKDKITNELVSEIVELLSNDGFQIEKNNERRKIKPSDIGILVKTNDEARHIKAQLHKVGVPAINLDESTVLKSTEAVELLYLLEAINDINYSKLFKALYTGLTEHSRSSISEYDQDALVERFKNYQQTWISNGINTAVRQFIKDFEIAPMLLKKNKAGERKLTNIFQLLELFENKQSKHNLNQNEFINWLSKSIYQKNVSEDDFIQRLESDEDAVKITTIHKSKGLEYPIVFAYNLDLKISRNFENVSFRNPNDSNYYYGNINELSDEQQEWFELQTKQEYRRLIYVAITRAIYKCYIFKSISAQNNDSAISPFYFELLKIKNELSDKIQFVENRTPALKQLEIKQWIPFQTLKIKEFKLDDLNWRKVSYSSITETGEKSLKPSSQKQLNEYDKFVFKELPKGSLTGNLIHYLFENISFEKNERYSFWIRHSIKRFNSDLENFDMYFSQLIEETLNCKIELENNIIDLKKITDENKITEMEFDFTISETYIKNLEKISSDKIKISVQDLGKIKGWMNGKIDLLFRYDKKYYILDWKSNFLGDHLDNYQHENLSLAMNESNYHLQYLLYTCAVKRYIESKDENFNYERDFGGVIYLFVRGIRKGSDSGVYIRKPRLLEIQEVEKILF